jgi:hypothetical protein
MMSDATYMEKLERVFRSFEHSLDLDIAFTVVDLTDAEREQLSKDEMLLARIAVCIAHERESMIAGLRDLAYGAESEGTRLSALKELGRTVYPKRFKSDADDSANKPPTNAVCVYIPDNGRDDKVQV